MLGTVTTTMAALALALGTEAARISCTNRCAQLGGGTGGGVSCISSHYYSYQPDDKSICLSVNHNSVTEGIGGWCGDIRHPEVPKHWSSYGGANCKPLEGSTWNLEGNGFLSFATKSGDLEGCQAGKPDRATQLKPSVGKGCTAHK